ncbi:aspartyl protease family protein [Morganella psychrotolerans]|uniref:aspartyl protease family protein n=1 Tax=Morganella psychrotolerans TaxID=368603 RepID=UPI0039B0D4E3
MEKEFNVISKVFYTSVTLLLSVTLSGCTGSSTPKDPVIKHSFKHQNAGYILVPVTIDNDKYTFLLDTASPSSVLDSALVNKLSDKVYSPPVSYKHYSDELEKPGTEGNVSFIKPVNFKIGNYTFNGGDVWVSNDLNILSQSTGERISGVLGIDIYRRLNWEVDNKNKTLTLYSNPPSLEEYEDCIPYSDVAFHSPHFSGNFNNKKRTEVSLDTGSESNYMAEDILKYLIKNNKATYLNEIENSVSTDITGVQESTKSSYYVSDFELNNTTFPGQRFSGNKKSESALGMDFFKSFDKYVLSPDRMLICYNKSEKSRLNFKRIRSLNLRATEGKVELFYNSAKVLKEHNLRNGDILININGTQYPASSVTKAGDLIDTLPDGDVKLIFNRNGELINVNL